MRGCGRTNGECEIGLVDGSDFGGRGIVEG